VSDGKAMRAANVGIIYVVSDKLWIDATPVVRARNFGDLWFHERYHCQYWEQLVKQRAVPDTEYERYPRGRVSYEKRSGKFRLLADRCILSDKALVAAILLQMNLPARDTETGTDTLYHCFRCLGRGR
jgi:hypothetical protein